MVVVGRLWTMTICLAAGVEAETTTDLVGLCSERSVGERSATSSRPKRNERVGAVS